jgi:ABC-2 type transport system ATP-binding protein
LAERDAAIKVRTVQDKSEKPPVHAVGGTACGAGESDGPAPVLSVADVSYFYGDKQALKDVSFDVRPGRVTALLGPNGAGKTTLFSLITRLFDAPEGRIEIAGRTIAQFGARALEPLGVVFQQPTLDLDLTVRQNLRYFAALRGMKKSEADQRMERALGELDMAERIGERVRGLNGGHRRRVEIARALLHEPKLLLLDEPTIGLDVPTRNAIVRHIHQLARTNDVGVLWATHLFDEIEPDDDLLVLDQGAIVERGKAGEVVARTGAEDLGAAFEKLIGRGPRRGAAAA